MTCRVCGQGFRVYWERTSLEEQMAMRAIVLKELEQHHAGDRAPSAHPDLPFNVPQWQGAPQFSRSRTLLGGLSSIRRLRHRRSSTPSANRPHPCTLPATVRSDSPARTPPT